MIPIGMLGGGVPIPTDGLLYWGKADKWNYSVDTAVTTFTDLSGNGNHFTSANGQFKVGATPAGGPGMYTTTSAWSSANVLAGASSGEIAWAYKPNTSDQPMEQNWGNDTGSGNHWPYQSANVYTDFGRTSRLGPLAIGITTVNVWHTVNMWSAPGDFGIWVDGVSRYSTGSNTVSWYSGNCEFGINCTVAEIVAYNRKLTTTERTDLSDYLDRHF